MTSARQPVCCPECSQGQFYWGRCYHACHFAKVVPTTTAPGPTFYPAGGRDG